MPRTYVVSVSIATADETPESFTMSGMAGVYTELPNALRRTVSQVRLEGLNTYTTKHIIDGIAIFKIFFRSGQPSGIEGSTAASPVAS